MNNWITWWARAQRGVGFMPEKCPPQIQIDIHDMPRCIALRFTFGTCYDCQPVIIKNVYCYCDKSQKIPVTFKGQTRYQLQPYLLKIVLLTPLYVMTHFIIIHNQIL